jgi:Protein of unknown function (DUF2637)
VSASEQAIRWSTVGAVVGLAGIAGWVSYEHAYSVVLRYGISGAESRVYPATVDGLIYAASMVLLDSARRGISPKKAPLLAWVMLALGVAATIVANVAAGLPLGLVDAAVYSWPAVPLAGAYELLMILIRTETATRSAPGSGAPAPESAPGDAPGRRERAPEPELEYADRTRNTPAPEPGVRTRSAPGPAAPDDSLLLFGTDHEIEMFYAADLSAGNVPSQRKIRADLHVGQDRAKEIQERLSRLVPSSPTTPQ